MQYTDWRNRDLVPEYRVDRPVLEGGSKIKTNHQVHTSPQYVNQRSETRQLGPLKQPSVKPVAKPTDEGMDPTTTGSKRKFAHTVSEDCTKDSAARHRAKFLALGNDDGPRLRFLNRLSRRDR